MSNRHEELKVEAQQLRQEILNAMTHLVFKHGNTLLRKKQQTITYDDYGNPQYEKFRIELDYFVKNVMCREVSDMSLNFLFSRDAKTNLLTVLIEILSRYEVMAESQSALQSNIDPLATTPIEYEHLCSRLLQNAGWATRVTTATGDQGIDVIATSGKIKLVVQCKLYSNPVGNAAVQEIIAGRAFERADHAAVVTNSTFTPSAKTLAAAASVWLLHHSELENIHSKLGLTLEPMAGESSTVDSNEQISTYLESLECRPINEIVQQVEMLIGELESVELKSNEDGLLDPMFEQAVEVVITNNKASISLVQRHMKIGYNRAARLVEGMEKMGIVSSVSISGQRALLIQTMGEFKLRMLHPEWVNDPNQISEICPVKGETSVAPPSKKWWALW